MFSIQLGRSFSRIGGQISVLKCSVRSLRGVPKTGEQYRSKAERGVEQPADPKLLRVAIIGRPNAGKSTLTNEIVNWNVSAVSPKVHTTHKNIVAVLSEGDTQIEFIDTPGLVHNDNIAKHKLSKSHQVDPENSLVGVDVIAVVTDIANKREQYHINAGILRLLRKNRDKESILILNKVDKISRKRNLIDFTAALTLGIVNGKAIAMPDQSPSRLKIERGDFEDIFYQTERKLKAANKEEYDIEDEDEVRGKGWPNFSNVFMISALNNDGISTLRSYLMSRAQRRPWLHNKDEVTTLPPKELILDALRQVCLDVLYQEIPYKIQFDIVVWHLDELDNLHIAADMICPDKFQSLIIGPKGTNISAIVRKAREALSSIFHCDVSLKLAVKSLEQKAANEKKFHDFVKKAEMMSKENNDSDLSDLKDDEFKAV